MNHRSPKIHSRYCYKETPRTSLTIRIYSFCALVSTVKREMCMNDCDDDDDDNDDNSNSSIKSEANI